MYQNNIKKVILIVLDGLGVAVPSAGNPVTSQHMPFLNSLISKYYSSCLVASGLVVGLEWGIYGNSEVGHSAMGTGRVVVQSLARIDNEIKNSNFFINDAFLKTLEHSREKKSRVHLVGCLSKGGIHSHEDHLMALIDFFVEHDFPNVYLHLILDGEDSPVNSGIESFRKIKNRILETGVEIATISGRNFAMDRVKNWELTKKVWDTMVLGGKKIILSPEEYILDCYNKKIFDSDIEPISLSGRMGQSLVIKDNDSIVFFNFRNDRMKQLVAPFAIEDFKEFNREKSLNNILVTTMTDYDDRFNALVAYTPQKTLNTLGEVLSENGKKQLRIAESEKEAHVTNFFNGGKLTPYEGEERIIVPSRVLKNKGYIEHPEMSAGLITKSLLDNVFSNHSLVVVNFANTDMVPHTGSMAATIEALSIIDSELKKIVEFVDTEEIAIIITADHGNAEELIDPSRFVPDTQHSTANVPLVIVNENFLDESVKNLDNLYLEPPVGSLIDIAPTILHLLQIDKPEEMSGNKIIL